MPQDENRQKKRLQKEKQTGKQAAERRRDLRLKAK